MQESIVIKIDEKVFAKDFSDTTNKEAIFRSLSVYLPSIEELLISYHFRSRGRVFGVEIDESTMLLTNSLSGSFRVNYNIGVFNACADLDFTEKEKMTIVYELQSHASKLILHGENIPERGPDEF